jgi:hypothetical protein
LAILDRFLPQRAIAGVTEMRYVIDHRGRMFAIFFADRGLAVDAADFFLSGFIFFHARTAACSADYSTEGWDNTKGWEGLNRRTHTAPFRKKQPCCFGKKIHFTFSSKVKEQILFYRLTP